MRRTDTSGVNHRAVGCEKSNKESLFLPPLPSGESAPSQTAARRPRPSLEIRRSPQHERQRATLCGSVAVRLLYSLLGAAAHLLSALHAPLPHVLLPPADSEAAAFLYDSLR